MASKVEFPIRAKILLLISGLLLAATGTYLFLATRLFREDKTALVYELNRNGVKTLAAEVDAYLQKFSDKLKLLTQGHRDADWTRAVFGAEPDLVAYSLYRPRPDGSWVPVAAIHNTAYLALYGQDATALDRIRQELPIPFAQVLAKGSWAANSTLANGAPLLTLAVPIQVRDDSDRAGDYVAVADLRSDRLIHLLSDRGIARLYVVDSEGRVVADGEGGAVVEHQARAEIPVVREALASPVALAVKRFEWKGRSWLGAYARVATGGLVAVSQVEEGEAFLASRRLLQKSLLFGLLVLTAALLLSDWFSRTLTGPLERLLSATEELSRWNFGGSIHVRTRDEIARLARAFNAMAGDLQSHRQQLEGSRSELETRVRERTADLERQKSQIVEAQDALLRTTKLASLGELAGAAAHEVLNPLNNINIRLERIRTQLSGGENEDLKLISDIASAWSDAYAKGGLPALEKELRAPSKEGGMPMVEEDLRNLSAISRELVEKRQGRQEDFDFLLRETARIGRIVNSMRSLSRVGGERRPLDIHVPIEETLNAITEQLARRKVSIVRDFGAETRDRFQVVADKDELVQVFSNLLRNAGQAVASAERRAGTIRVSTRLGEGGRVEVRIIDNGTGIQPSHLEKIFEPSFTTKSLEEGTGLGLSISRRLVRAFSGDIIVEHTAVGDGTTFLVWFPKA